MNSVFLNTKMKSYKKSESFKLLEEYRKCLIFFIFSNLRLIEDQFFC